MSLNKLISIVGTTASGKSSLGIELAEHYGAEIISADSRQVYRHLVLGTGKVTEEEMARVKHHMIDVIDLNDSFSMAEFQSMAYDVIDGIKNGNEQARKAFDKWQNDLTCGLIMLANVFDPEKIILSGSMAKFIEYEKVNKAVNEAILTQPFILEEAKFENNAGMIGAALLLFGKNT